MNRQRAFTLIELMITVAIVAILAAVAYPSYQDHVRRSVRSQGQQYLMDLAQRQEQFFLDRRAYTDTEGAGGLGMSRSADLATRYQAPVIVITAGPPPTFRIAMAPVAGSVVANDGTLLINNLQQRWRETDGNGAYGAANDCLWEDARCKPS